MQRIPSSFYHSLLYVIIAIAMGSVQLTLSVYADKLLSKECVCSSYVLFIYCLYIVHSGATVA